MLIIYVFLTVFFLVAASMYGNEEAQSVTMKNKTRENRIFELKKLLNMSQQELTLDFEESEMLTKLTVMFTNYCCSCSRLFLKFFVNISILDEKLRRSNFLN